LKPHIAPFFVFMRLPPPGSPLFPYTTLFRSRIRFAPPPDISVGELPVPARPDGDGLVTVESAEPTMTLHQLTEWALRRDCTLDQLVVERPSLEDVYLRLTRDDAAESTLEGSLR